MAAYNDYRGIAWKRMRYGIIIVTCPWCEETFNLCDGVHAEKIIVAHANQKCEVK